uniref:Cytochrome P450 n=1 Tax=Panagrolaimus sp. JU765 TaxID=591449 RepID=A0AC34RAI7_9BILA
MSKPIMEEKILLEVGHLFEIINNELGCSTSNPVEINLNPLIEITIANIIHQLIFGFAYHDKKSRDEYAKWKDLVADHMRNFVSLPILLGLEKPEIFEYLPYFGTKLKLLRRQYEQIIDYCSKQIENHKKDEKDGNFQDYVEAYLTEIRKENPNFDQKQLVNILYDFFLAGQETTANTIIFALIFALNYPKTQERIHKELDKIVGSDRQITVADRSQLVYCQAFINEALRMSNLLPLNLYHTNLKDVEIAGYKIKAGTRIVPQISNILYDSKVFPNPQVFKPERFIDNNGNLKKIEEFVPFSVGKRQCLGESLAKMELHIILTNFFNNYKITAIENELPSMEKIHGVTVQPKPFKCLIQKRNQGF